ncbi:MAG: hypothetical protein Q7U64_14965 [Desulfocapsaceae bacterium]|nr:hypothetical protein [Desulfocapsaceae bacterium]
MKRNNRFRNNHPVDVDHPQQGRQGGNSKKQMEAYNREKSSTTPITNKGKGETWPR